MSRAATDWAWSLELKAPQKILVLSLADRADEYHCCYPSIQRLVKDTGLDKKTIGKWINQMIDDGLITDTGERKGPTKRVRVLRLNIEIKCTQKRDDTKNGNIPKNGCLNDPKFGCLNDPKFGSQNQSLEPVIEPKDLTPVADAPPEQLSEPSRYAFEGQIVKLNQEDFQRWSALYSNIDLVYELQKLDIEFTHDPPKKWFITASQKLNYQNKQAVTRGVKPMAEEQTPHWNSREGWEDFI